MIVFGFQLDTGPNPLHLSQPAVSVAALVAMGVRSARFDVNL